MAMKGSSVDSAPSNNKELSKDIYDHLNSDKNIDDSVNSEAIEEDDKDPNFSKGNTMVDNGSVFGTSDNPPPPPASSLRRENNGVRCISSNSTIQDCANKKSKMYVGKNNGSFVGSKKASIAVSDVDGRAFDILLK